MSNCSLALQILPMQADRPTTLAVVDEVIAYIRQHTDHYEVAAFETTIEGPYEEVMAILQGAIQVAAQHHPKIFTNVKINLDMQGDVLTIDEKVEKHRQ